MEEIAAEAGLTLGRGREPPRDVAQLGVALRASSASRRTGRSRTRSSRRPSRRPTSSSCGARRWSRRGSSSSRFPKKERAILCRRFGIPEDGSDGEREPMTLQEIGEELQPLARAGPPDRGAGHRAHQADDEEPGPESLPELGPRIRPWPPTLPTATPARSARASASSRRPRADARGVPLPGRGPRRGAAAGPPRFPSATGTAGIENFNRSCPDSPSHAKAHRAGAIRRRVEGASTAASSSSGPSASGRRTSPSAILAEPRRRMRRARRLLRLLRPPRPDSGDVLAREPDEAPTTSSRPTATPSSSSSTSSARRRPTDWVAGRPLRPPEHALQPPAPDDRHVELLATRRAARARRRSRCGSARWSGAASTRCATSSCSTVPTTGRGAPSRSEPMPSSARAAPEAFRRGLSAVVANPGLILAPVAFAAAARRVRSPA